MKKINKCYICGNNKLKKIFSTIDYTLTNERFNVLECLKCEIRHTSPVPNKNELPKYYESKNYRPHKNKSYNPIDYIYNIIRDYMFFKKRKLIKNNTNSKKRRLLDIGCGTGEFASFMKNSDWEVYCVDSSLLARKIAKQKFNLQVLDINEFFNLKNLKFDAITLWHTLEHVDQPLKYIQKAKQLLDKNGNIFLGVPNFKSFDSEFFGQYWAANDVPRHLYHFSKKSVEKIFIKSDLNIHNIKGLPFDAYYVSYLSSKYKKSSLLNSIFIGFISNFKANYNISKYSSLIYIAKKNHFRKEMI